MKLFRIGRLLSAICTRFLNNCIPIDEIIEEECEIRMEFELPIKLRNLKREINHCAIIDIASGRRSLCGI